MAESRKRAILSSATVDFDSVAAGGVEIEAVTVRGARTGDVVLVNSPSAEVGLSVDAYVSDTDEVTIRAFNPTGAPIDPASQDFSLAIIGG
jgi:hypothetical protein